LAMQGREAILKRLKVNLLSVAGVR
jgi:hypothetical protein